MECLNVGRPIASCHNSGDCLESYPEDAHFRGVISPLSVKPTLDARPVVCLFMPCPVGFERTGRKEACVQIVVLRWVCHKGFEQYGQCIEEPATKLVDVICANGQRRARITAVEVGGSGLSMAVKRERPTAKPCGVSLGASPMRGNQKAVDTSS